MYISCAQLLCVLPKESGGLLPKAYAKLMWDATSPIADAFPSDFRVDMNGKNWDWVGVCSMYVCMYVCMYV